MLPRVLSKVFQVCFTLLDTIEEETMEFSNTMTFKRPANAFLLFNTWGGTWLIKMQSMQLQ